MKVVLGLEFWFMTQILFIVLRLLELSARISALPNSLSQVGTCLVLMLPRISTHAPALYRI